MEQKEYWDSTAGVKEFTTPFQREEFKRFVPTTARILDIGCGYGRTLAELHASGYRDLSGCDFSTKLLEECAKRVPDAKLTVGDACALPYDSESFDAAILFAVQTCIVDDAAQERMAAEAWRVLRPGGVLYVNDFMINTDERNRARYEKYADRYVYGGFELPEGAVLRHHSQEHIEKLYARFKTLLFEKTVFKTMNGHVSNGFCLFAEK